MKKSFGETNPCLEKYTFPMFIARQKDNLPFTPLASVPDIRTTLLAGIPLETIRDLLGHEDTKTTIQYLGINMDDKSDAMKQLAKFQSALKRANLELASVNGGRTGI
jgi:hypothetical protein